MKAITLKFRNKGYPKGTIQNCVIGDGKKAHDMFDINYQFGNGNTKQRLLITQDDAKVMVKKIELILYKQMKAEVRAEELAIQKRIKKERIPYPF